MEKYVCFRVSIEWEITDYANLRLFGHSFSPLLCFVEVYF